MQAMKELDDEIQLVKCPDRGCDCGYVRSVARGCGVKGKCSGIKTPIGMRLSTVDGF